MSKLIPPIYRSSMLKTTKCNKILTNEIGRKQKSYLPIFVKTLWSMIILSMDTLQNSFFLSWTRGCSSVIFAANGRLWGRSQDIYSWYSSLSVFGTLSKKKIYFKNSYPCVDPGSVICYKKNRVCIRWTLTCSEKEKCHICVYLVTE